MAMLLHDDIAGTWARLPALRRDSLRWTWFRPAFFAVLAARADASLASPDEDAVAAAFLAWAPATEACETHAEVDALDHLHFVAGMLLQHLLAARPPVFTGSQVPSGASAQWPQGQALAAFVLTLLQAWRLHAGAAGLQTGVPDAHAWRSLRENVAEDAASAIAWLDQLCGLQPVWEAPTLIGSRPAMLRARAQRG